MQSQCGPCQITQGSHALDLKCVTDKPTHGKNHLEHVQASALGGFGPRRVGPHKGGLVCLCMAAFFLGGRDRHRGDASVWQSCAVSQLRPEKLPSVLTTRLAKAQLASTFHSSKEGEEGRSHTAVSLQSMTGSQPALCGDCPRLLR